MNRKFTPCLVALLVGILMLGACSDNLMDELPRPITTFVNTYFPGSGVSDYQFRDDIYTVTVTGGTVIDFNLNLMWVRVDGKGNTIPAILVNDQLPPGLLEYLQSMQMTDAVYAVSRTDTSYRVTLSDTVLSYDIATGKITYPDGRTYLTD